MSKRNPRSYRQVIQAELDTLPLMGLFVVLIPMLLLSAVFLEISVIDMYLPNDPGEEQQEEDFTISVRIHDDQYVVAAEGFAERVIPRTEDEAINDLHRELYAIASKRPDHKAVTIVSEPATRYEDIITVMDISRAAGLPQASLMGEGS
jgi:biopolymer transport protein ExbD